VKGAAAALTVTKGAEGPERVKDNGRLDHPAVEEFAEVLDSRDTLLVLLEVVGLRAQRLAIESRDKASARTSSPTRMNSHV
jgi:hypothetical protein